MDAMSESVADILGGRIPKEPKEIHIIKRFVREKFKSDVSVMIQERQIIISVQSAALAGALRLHLHELKKLCETQKRLVIRIR